MKPFKDISIRYKIISIVMLISFLIVGVISIIYFILENHRINSELAKENTFVANIIARQCSESLLLNDKKKTENTLQMLNETPHIVSAFVYTKEKTLFSSYNPEGIDIGHRPASNAVKSADRNFTLINRDIIKDHHVIGSLVLVVDSEKVINEQQMFLKIIIGIAVLLLIIVYLLAHVFQRSISIPILKLAAITEKVTSKANYSLRLKNDRKDEIGMLYKSFNNMLRKLEKRDTDHLRSSRKLKKAKELAEKADKLKSAFLANMSHEIRTPMNSIIGFADLLAENSDDDDENKAYIQLIKTSSIRLLHLIDDILDISKMEAGQLKIVKTEFELISLMREIETTFDEENKNENLGNVHLNHVIPSNIDTLWISTDEIRLRQIISNLLSNAIKFTSNGTISFGFELTSGMYGNDKHMIRFFVKDTGVGMSLTTQKIIFDRFTKIEPDKTKYHQGTGLGLTICKKLVEYLNGTISVKSQLGKGSEFSFTIPHIKVTHKEERTSVTSFMTGETTKSSLTEKNILIVEDEKTNFELIKTILRNSGAQIHWAKNGQEALQYCESINFDLVLMDIKMPVMNGYDTVDNMRKRGYRMPVIAQTAYALPEDVREIQSHEFDAYLPKPIVRRKLIKTIEKLIH